MNRFSGYKKSLSFPGHFEERATVNPKVSLLDLTLEAGILGDVITFCVLVVTLLGSSHLC